MQPMKVHVWQYEMSLRHRQSEAQPERRRTVAEILRMAYRQHTRDPYTRKAVKRCLR